MRRAVTFSLVLLSLSFFVVVFGGKEKKKEAETTKEKDSNTIEPADAKAEDPSGGFGTDIDWVKWPKAIPTALDVDKPIFLLIHKSWCGACQALKRSFASSSKRKELVELSKKFVMVNTEDDEEPQDEAYSPDGSYIPRLFILRKSGEPLPVDNKENFPNNIAYFPQAPDVIQAMKRGLKLLEEGQRPDPAEEVPLPDGLEPEGPPKSERGKAKKESDKKQEAKTEAGQTDKMANKKEGSKAKDEKPKEKSKDKEQAAKKEMKEPQKNSKKTEEAAEGDEKTSCPHAAGKAAAKKKVEEEANKNKKKQQQNGKQKTDEDGKTDEGKGKKEGKAKKETKEKEAVTKKKKGNDSGNKKTEL